jgi:hypothetical protein
MIISALACNKGFRHGTLVLRHGPRPSQALPLELRTLGMELRFSHRTQDLILMDHRAVGVELKL